MLISYFSQIRRPITPISNSILPACKFELPPAETSHAPQESPSPAHTLTARSASFWMSDGATRSSILLPALLCGRALRADMLGLPVLRVILEPPGPVHQKRVSRKYRRPLLKFGLFGSSGNVAGQGIRECFSACSSPTRTDLRFAVALGPVLAELRARSSMVGIVSQLCQGFGC